MITNFRGDVNLTCEENLVNFIKFSKENTKFKDVNFDFNSWDITTYVPKKNSGHETASVYFCSWRDNTGNSKFKNDFMQEPFLSFAKAAFSEYMREEPKAEYRRFVVALQVIEQSLLDLNYPPNVIYLNQNVMNNASSLLFQKYKDPWTIGKTLVFIVKNYVNMGRLSKVYVDWKCNIPYKKPFRNDLINVENDIDKKNKLPDPNGILALADIFVNSTNINDKIVTAFVALAMFSPARATEILSLPVDCITSASDGDNTLMGIRWRPSKCGDPMTKFAITPESEDIARKAIKFLKDLGAQARVAAEWYQQFENSSERKIYLPPGFEHLRGEDLTLHEISMIIGRKNIIPSGATISFGIRIGAKRRSSDKRRMAKHQQHLDEVELYSFGSLERSILKRIPKKFPILDDSCRLYWKDALFVLPANSLVSSTEPLFYVPESISIHSINHQLGHNPGGNTIFSRNNKVNVDGEFFYLTTHKFRHLLNTLAQSKYLSQELIAFWSGRKSVKQNEFYNHITQESYIEAYLHLEEHAPKVGVVGPLLDKVESRSLNESISYDEALKLELGAIHITRYGLCRHDYALTPCPKDKDCINCGEHYVVKGDLRHLREAKFQLKMFKTAVNLCQKAVEDDEPGAQKWLGRHQASLKRWQKSIDILQDDSIPDGTVITLPPPVNSQSKTGLAQNVRAINKLKGNSVK